MFKKLLGLLLACLMLLGAVGVAYATGAETAQPDPEPAVFTVSFETYGGTAVEAQTVEENGTAVRPADPVREGYDFAGWYADVAMTEVFDFGTPITADLTLYAEWTEIAPPAPAEVTVTFNTEGGSAVAAQTVHAGETAARPDDPTREGFAFEGWFLDGAAFDFSTPVTENITLYAHWTEYVEPVPVTHTVTFVSNGGTATVAQTVAENGTAVRPGDPARSGYTFAGWYADAALTRAFDFSAPITADVTAYAAWTENPPPTPASVDLRLSWLQIACGDLRPAFSPDVYSYTVYVTPGQENRSCFITCDTVDRNARVEAEGPQSVGRSDIVRKVRVAGGGRYAEYTIVVHVLTFRERMKDGVLYAITDRPDVSALPGTFTVGHITMDGERVTAAQSTDGQMLMVQFTSQPYGSESMWFRYETSSRKLYPASVVEVNRDKYILVDEGKQLLYGSEAGVGTLYVYDPETRQMIFQTKDYDELTVQMIPTVFEKTSPRWPVTIVLGVWALLATAAVYFLVRRSKREKKNSFYFRPVFSAEEESAAEEEKTS